MVDTVRDIITDALTEAKILGAGEPLSPSDAGAAQRKLTQMIDAWSLDNLLIPVTSQITITLLAGEPTYTIGNYVGVAPTNHKETTRPVEFQAAFIRDGSGTDYEVEIFDVGQWAEISRKTNAARPSRMYIQNGWPLNTIRLENVPYADETLHLMVIQPLAEILSTASLNDEISLPPGYLQAIVYNLALLVQPSWGKDQNNTTTQFAINTLRKIKRRNYQPSLLRVDSALSNNNSGKGTYIIESGP